jgi:PadR family transcriptional regulator, regulatory protein PadR
VVSVKRRHRPSPQTLAVLLALAARPQRWSHGHDPCRPLDLKPGTVYPILIRLAERGLLVTAWEEDPPKGRPARHLYRISPDGAGYARELRLEAAARAAERGAADPGIAGGAAGGAIAGVVL